MLPSNKQKTRYSIFVKNKPGELAKLTKLLADASLKVSNLLIASLGPKASIQFSAPGGNGLQDALRKNRLRAEID